MGSNGVAGDDGVLGIEGEALVARLAEGLVRIFKSWVRASLVDIVGWVDALVCVEGGTLLVPSFSFIGVEELERLVSLFLLIGLWVASF